VRTLWNTAYETLVQASPSAAEHADVDGVGVSAGAIEADRRLAGLGETGYRWPSLFLNEQLAKPQRRPKVIRRPLS
jgi:hypothetical protein